MTTPTNDELHTYLETLSGRVHTVENSQTYMTQDLLQRPDLTAYSSLSTTWNQQYSEVSNAVNVLQGLVRTLQTLYVNLNKTVGDNYDSFLDHTGRLVTGGGPNLAHSGHTWS